MTGDDKSVNESHCWPGARDEINGKTEREAAIQVHGRAMLLASSTLLFQ